MALSTAQCYQELPEHYFGVIVQPSWTSEQGQKPDPKIKAKVEVTQQRIDEVKALREEISKGSAQETENERQVQQLTKELNAQQAGREALGKVVGSAHDSSDDDLVGAGEQTSPNGMPNLVEANSQVVHEFDMRKLRRLEFSKRRNREALILKSVEEDFTFNLGDDVQQWAHIQHNGTEYFVGRRERDLLIVHKESATYKTGIIVDVGQHISYLTTYSFWNDAQSQTEGVILVAEQDRVLWYRVNNVTRRVELYWQWVVGNTITGLTYFTVESKDYVVVSTNQSSHTGFYTLNIYQFDLGSREFWIAQRMQLEFPCPETTLLDTGRDLILAVPQNQTAAIYTFNPRADTTDYLRFKLKQQIASDDIESIASFKMGGRSYIAIGGQQPQILLYQQGELLPKTILAHNFGVVQLFFPVPVRTYRDDLILLVQHRVDFSTHSLTVLETLIWDGEAFEASIPVPCKLGKHTVFGVSCMLDIQRDAGLKGAAYFRRGDEVSLIVPRHNAESGLFKLHTELLAKNSEYLDLQEIFAFLKDWVKEQDDLVAQAQTFLQGPAGDTPMTQPDLTQLEELETPELLLDDGEVGEIYVNDYRWTDEDTLLHLDHVITAIEQLASDLNIARHRRDTAFDEFNFEHLEFDSLEVDEMIVQQVNGEDFYVKDGMLEFNGLLNVQDMQVLEHLGAAEEREADDENEDESSIEESDTLVFDGDLEFESINGISWQEIKENMVFTDVPLGFTQLEVDGEVVIENKISLNALNSLDFPDDFLWSDGPTVSVVRGEKTFTDTLSVKALDTEGLLNAVNASDAITLSGAQEWLGHPTFANLKITEIFQLNGTTRGRDIGNLPNNPTLKDSNQIEAICNFKQLQVHGPIHIKGLYDGQPLEPLLRDIVQRPAHPEATITVRAKKRFSDVQMPLDFEVLDGKLNNIPVENFVPAHTKQTLDMTALQAYVYFSNLTLSGRYDGVDLEELMQNAIRIDQPQVALDTHLSFANALQSDEVDVTTSLNGAPIAENYQTIDEDMNIPVAYFELLQAKEADILGNIEGDNAKWNMHSQAQSDEDSGNMPTGNIYIEELKLAYGLDVDEIHGINASLVWSFLDEIDDLPQMVLDGKIVVDHVIVTGDVHVHKLNQQRFDEDLQLTIVWLNRPNYLSTRLTFSDPLVVHGKLQINGAYNGMNLQAIIDDMIFREPTNGTVQVFAPKSFTQRVQVVRDTHLEALNGIPFSDIATKKTICNFRGTLQLHGNLIVNELELAGALNGQPMSAFSRAIRFDHDMRNFIMQGVVNFSTQQLHLQDLTVRGQLNEMPNLAHFFDELVYKDKVCMLKGSNTFTGRVSIEKGAYIRNLNGYNLLTLFDNIVYVNEPQPVLIRAPLTFKGSVRAQNWFVQDTLEATHLNGFALKEWFTDTLRLDKPQEIEQYLIFAPCSLNGNSFYASYLNDIDLSQVITLHTAQNLTGNITFSELHLDGQIHVQGAVNGVDLEKEYANTLMTHGNQHVITPLTLHSALVRGNLRTNAPVNNDKDLREVAMLNGDQHFESPLYFEDVNATEVKTKYRMSGINMDEWFRTALRTAGKSQQFITGNWSARTLNVNSGPTLPSYLASGRPRPMPFGALIRSVREGKQYEDLCEQLRRLVKKQQRRGYQLKYLERAFELDLKREVEADADRIEKIQAVFAMENEGVNYLLINMVNQTRVLKWNPLSGMYDEVVIFQSGTINQVIAMEAAGMSVSNTIHFVTNKAGVEGSLKYWRLERNNLTLLKSFEKPATELMLSAHMPDKLYALNTDTVYGYDLSKLSHTNTWFLPDWLDNTSYRFVPHHSQALMVTNGEVILLFNDDEFSARDKRTSAPNYSLPLSYQRVIRPQAYNLTEVVLKPNASLTHQFQLADFRVVIGHILDDLNYRLRLEVNITQLSIPETDLHDEHLMQDFIAIMEELRRQKIYPNTTFESIEWDMLQLPENPAQVLAGRTVQILWPSIVDMEEIQGYLQGADAADVASIMTIMDHLGTTVRDVLILANSIEDGTQLFEGDDAAAHAWELSAVIECIRSLQHYLENTVRVLKAEALKETQAPTTREEDLEMSASVLDATDKVPTVETPIEFTRENNTWLKFANRNLPAPGAGEILPILVRAHSSEPLELLAVTVEVPQLVGMQQAEVVLYLDVLSGTRFQSISARKPHSLITLQIATETLLAFVEDCCTIRVFVYRGVQGFVEFVSFKSEADVLKIFAVMLHDSDGLEQRPHLGVAHAVGLVFYRFVGAGSTLRMPANLLCN
ncbi:LOW QUALITY PROTEIN: uncharacterized protein LOC118751532 [Rhagoletis pomonella]|uniref:LOW QUALITY PROTEIN: uncharacterized protein LOC118751532 n=1 Tax=Rhagoletis pomonella TaxID=28610 RepID=UPI00177D55D4|nr:LOW QUALITY PROTEIN: uncharacterized protein LOC118751532 [Rhagoletis pomonella]